MASQNGRSACASGYAPVLYLVACGASPAGQLPAFVRDAHLQGWNVCVITTPDGSKFVDAATSPG